MADIKISGPDGSSFSFPEGTNSDVIKGAMKKHYGGPKREPVGPQEPMYDPASGAAIGYTQPSVKPTTMPYGEQVGKALEATGEIYKAGGRGLAKGALGSPGAIEEFAAYSVPEYFGAKKSKERPTLFPTPEKIGGMMESIGLGKTPEQYRGFETAAEIVGGLKGYGPRGGELAGEVAKVGTAAKETVAGTMPARAIEKTFGKASTSGEVGEKLEKSIVEKLQDYIKTRSENFEGVKNAYYDAGAKFEGNILNDYKQSLAEIWAKRGNRLSPDERALIDREVVRLADIPAEIGKREGATVAPAFEAIEKERRFLSDVAQGLEVKGAEAIPAKFAQELSGLLEGVISKYIPKEFGSFNETYQALSAPINRYNTALGKKVTARADEFLPEISKIDPKEIPSKFFKSKRTVDDLKALAGDEKLVQQAARQHLANDLEGIKTAEKFQTYLRENREWLQEFPDLQSEVVRLAGAVRGGERIKNLGKLLVGGGAVGKVFGLY